MGWPTKGTGKNYNSHTGFGSLLGAYNKKALMTKIYCRRCRYCESARRRDVTVNDHKCVQNFPSNKSSKSMEAAAVLDMICRSATERQFVIKAVVSDDDSVMRAHLRYNVNPHDKEDKGKLPLWIPEPEFLADPGHRVKCVSKYFYKLAKQKVAKSRVTKGMAKRLKKNWGYMIKQNKGGSLEDFVKNAHSPLEHLFNNHAYCSSKWCNALKAEEEGKIYTHPDGFCDKTTDDGKKMYEQLSEITHKYGNEYYLKQSMHPFTTQTNEALNYSQACVTPKSKSFHESYTFHYRHAITIGCHNWGFLKFWTSVFDSLGIIYSQAFQHHLAVVEKKRIRWKGFHQKNEVKKRRAYRQDATERRLIYENRTVEYASGMGLDLGNETATRTIRTTTTTTRKRCRCGSTTHQRTSSKECRLNKRNLLLATLCGETKEGEEEVPSTSNISNQDELHEIMRM